MSEFKIAKVIQGIDFNEFWYCLSVGNQNRGQARKNSVDQVKLHKKHKEEKVKKEKKDKEKKDKGE